MKKYLIIFIILILCITACGKAENTSNTSSNSLVQEALNSGVASAEGRDEPDDTVTTSNNIVTSSDEAVDIDLTKLSSTMVYAEVNNICLEPDKYVGKKVKMRGFYTEFFEENSNQRFFTCYVLDVTACCSQGLEFELNSDYTYPNDYPTEGDNITVVGTFDVVFQDEYMYYCVLRDAKFV